jgi:hypothetical protein
LVGVRKLCSRPPPPIWAMVLESTEAICASTSASVRPAPPEPQLDTGKFGTFTGKLY